MTKNESSKNKLSLSLAIILGINAVVGSGIFTMPITLFRHAGPAGILTVLLSAFFIILIGMALARVAFLIPEDGGFYTYVSSWGGPNLGITATFSYLIGLTIALGLISRIVATIISIYMVGIEITYISYFIAICVFIATLFAESMAKVGQIILFILTIIPILFITALCFKTISFDKLTPFFAHGVNGIFYGIPTVVFSFLGFEAISSMTRVIKNPQKNIPLATISIILIVSAIYSIFVSSIISSIDHNLILTKSTLSEILIYAYPKISWIVHFLNISIIITMLGTVYAMMLSLVELLSGSIKKITENRVNIPNTFCILFLSTLMTISMQYFSNIDKTFNWIALCVSVTYLLAILYLIIKPKSLYDSIIGILGIFSSMILIITAILQLI
jgi:amino acid transporter